MTEHNLQQKKTKRLRLNRILESLVQPMTPVLLEFLHKAGRNTYTPLLKILHDEGYIENLGQAGHSNVWKAIKFDYREDGVDYDAQPVVTASLADAHYIHDANAYAKKYSDTAAQTNRERKSAKVYVSGAQAYASF